MKIFNKAVIIPVIFLLISFNATAQKNFAKDADKAFANKEFFTAIELYKKGYAKAKKKQDKARMLYMTAECYRIIGDVKQMETWYSKADKAKYPDPKAILYLADSKKAQGKYDEAIVEYNRYMREVPADPRGSEGAKSCELAQKWKDNPSRYVVENMAMINSREADFSPTYASKKYSTLYFTTTREGLTGGKVDGGLGQNFSDIVETKRDKNGKWSTPVALAEPPNTKDNEGASFVSRKGTNIYYTRCGVQKNQQSKCQLYMAIKRGNTWAEEIKLPFCVDSFNFGHPTLNMKDDFMIFASDMPGGYGGKDLWYSVYDKKGKTFGKAVNMGADVNTTGNEMYPFLHEDGSLYYSSDGLLGMGGLDIFKAEVKGENKWGKPENLKAPINSASDDFAIIFEGKKERGYFASNRQGGKGGDDIYSFVLPPIVFSLSGTITDCKYNIPLDGVVIRLVGSDGTNVELKTNKEGKYEYIDAGAGARYINMNTSYVVSTEAKGVSSTYADGYLNSTEKGKITTVGEMDSKNFVQDFCLVPAEKEIKFPAVLYDLGKATLRPESKDSLNYLYQTLVDNPTIKIELAAHTDARGSDAMNMKLSDARAKSCVDYLSQEKGIPLERLGAKGFGETRPLKIGEAVFLTEDYIAKTSKGNKEIFEGLHQKNRRTVFRVTSWDYVDPNAPKPAPIVKPKVFGQEGGYEEEDESGTPEGTPEQPKAPEQPK